MRPGTRNQHNEDIGSILGPHGIPYVNDRGRLALPFLRRQGLCSVSSFFQQKNKTTHTYVHHGSQTQSPDLRQTDFVLTPFSELKRVQQCVFHDGLVSSDHRGIITPLKVSFQRSRRKKSLKPRTIRRNWVQLRDNEQIREEYNIALALELSLLKDKTDSTAVFGAITNAIENTVPELKKDSKTWFTRKQETLLPLLHARTVVHCAWRQEQTDET